MIDYAGLVSAEPKREQDGKLKDAWRSGTTTRPNAKNAGETALLYEGDAKSDAFDLSSWCELRDAIAVCPDLPEEARQSLIEQGDAAADG